MRTVYDYLREHGGFHALLAIAKIAGLERYLKDERDFTLFAPTDGAFALLPPSALDAFLANPETLLGLLAFHCLPERITSETMRGFGKRESLAEKRFAVFRGVLHVNGTKIIGPDIVCENGIIHIVSGILKAEKVRIH
jgi:uncharacterized surface protein with fasciclin (FAS1) repeats